MSQSELAGRAGVPVQTLQSWEAERRTPRIDALLSLAKALNIELSELVGERRK